MNNDYYETSILAESSEGIKIYKKELLKENIENYKNKLLSIYWTEINLIGYKIELLEKQKVEFTKELERKIIVIENKIRWNIERHKRICLNCGATKTIQWYIYIKENYLCSKCGDYNRKFGKHRPKKFWINIKKEDRHCAICKSTETSAWYRHVYGQHLCKSCYNKQYKNTKNRRK
uniref:GATA-type domain-containing protein n=1 Tax=Meloidogyne enterolobii TaxID=390850 RepID=A0A6V7XWJ8_MELEN|nr:unnamed protein product [Meloidogyne enterolobii]